MREINMQNEQQESAEISKLRHDLNNDLAVVGSFLALCHTLNVNETFSTCLSNAEESFGEVLQKISGMKKFERENLK